MKYIPYSAISVSDGIILFIAKLSNILSFTNQMVSKFDLLSVLDTPGLFMTIRHKMAISTYCETISSDLDINL